MNEHQYLTCTRPHELLRELRRAVNGTIGQWFVSFGVKRDRLSERKLELLRGAFLKAHAELPPELARYVTPRPFHSYTVESTVVDMVMEVMERDGGPEMIEAWWAAMTHQCDLIRDIFGDPFRRSHLDPAWLAWNNGTIPQLARAIYDEGRFADLPILADALEDAGCTDTIMLTHCRQPAEHVRGCWVVDLLLGYE